MGEPVNVEVKFGQWIEQGFGLYKTNFGLLVLAMLIVFALGTVTLGILLPPLCAGFILITLRLLDGTEPPPVAGDVFKGFSCFLQSFLFGLVWFVVMMIGVVLLGLVPCVGQFAALFFCYALEALLLFGLYLIAEQNLDFWTASTRSMEVVKTSFWPILALTIVAGLIGSLGAIACGIGAIFTAPITFCIITVAYRDIFGGGPAAVQEAPRVTRMPAP
ncbi:MAG: hypothetical protein ACLFPD_00710 [Desulfosudaceae bacterium]